MHGEKYKGVHALPMNDELDEQIREVEKMKAELARKGVDISIETLKVGMVSLNPEERFLSGPRKYPAYGAGLPSNPFKKKNKKAKKKTGARRSRFGRSKSKSPTRRKTKSKSPAKSPRKKEAVIVKRDDSDDDDDDSLSPKRF